MDVRPKLLTPRAREAFLMYHYTKYTCSTFYQGCYNDLIFREAIPNEAFKHDFLLDGLLGLTALHYAMDHPSHQQAEWTEVALEYQNRALASFSLVIQNVTPELCHAAFAFSILILFLTFAAPCGGLDDTVEHALSSRHRKQSSPVQSSPVQPTTPVHTRTDLPDLHGIIALATDSAETLKTGSLKTVFDNSKRNGPVSLSPVPGPYILPLPPSLLTLPSPSTNTLPARFSQA